MVKPWLRNTREPATWVAQCCHSGVATFLARGTQAARHSACFAPCLAAIGAA
ncbi:hypothetical protein BC940DRAFT_314373 [Gongronella butleri]|nr:hypothetical protein BC940DRAFT_314373 [Gongronella butleri]